MKITTLDNSAKVDEFIAKLDHSGKDIVEFVRRGVLEVDSRITEGIKWNAPCFHYRGDMAVFNLHPSSPARMIFIDGATVDSEEGLFSKEFADGRRLIVFKDMSDAVDKLGRLKQAVRRWVEMSDQKGE
jgi:hypothetical protein